MQLFDKENQFLNVYKSKKLWQWVGILFCFICGVSISGFALFNLLTVTEEEIVTSQDIKSQVCEQSPDFGELTVFISGAVEESGLYVLPFGSRVSDLLEMAGGISNSADIVYVHKQVNFAQRLSDGEQIYIPTKSETEKQFIENTNDSEIGPISINSSTLDSLMSLNGVGEVRAQKIIENRPYSSLTQLVEKEVISETLYTKIEPEIGL
jgi:competence protein ComEA